MRRLAWLMLFLVCACGRHNPKQDRWILIVESPITAYYVSREGIENTKPTMLHLEVKTVYKRGNTVRALGLGSAINENEYDCTAHQMRIRVSEAFYRNGNSYGAHVIADTTWHTLKHGSDAEVVLSEICTRFGNGT